MVELIARMLAVVVLIATLATISIRVPSEPVGVGDITPTPLRSEFKPVMP